PRVTLLCTSTAPCPPPPASPPYPGLDQPDRVLAARPSVSSAAPHRPPEPAEGPGHLLLQPPQLVGSLHPHGDAAHAAAPHLLRAEGGGHDGGRAEPPDELARRDDPVPAGQERPARGDPPGRRRAPRRRRRRDRGGGEDPAVRV